MKPPADDNPYLAALAMTLALLIYVLCMYIGAGDLIAELLR